MFVMEHLIKMVEWLMLRAFHQLIHTWVFGVQSKLQSNLMPLENLQILWSDLQQFLNQIWHFGSNISFWILLKSVSCIILKVRNASFITAIFQNTQEIFGLCVFLANYFITVIFMLHAKYRKKCSNEMISPKIH